MNLGPFQNRIQKEINALQSMNAISRIWNIDHTVWKPEPTEIANRLGWLTIADEMETRVEEINDLVQEAICAGYTQAVLLGMGGSSLAPEVFQRTFGTKEGFLDLWVLDSTDPGTVLTYADKLDAAKTLFIVSTKSGGTVETLSFFKFFYNWMQEKGIGDVSNHFIAITDPGSKLETMAKDLNFRKTFINNPNIGGRFSALSFFGLVPAALLGADLYELLKRTKDMMSVCQKTELAPEKNMGGFIGAVMSALAAEGRNKLTFVMSDAVISFGDWVEQLIAESTGKEGKGILPVVGEPEAEPSIYGEDRIFINITMKGDSSKKAWLDSLAAAGHPVLTLEMNDLYDLGKQMFVWEMATAVSGIEMQINPFDQPNVESAKVSARAMVTAFEETGSLPEDTPEEPSSTVLDDFLNDTKTGNYIAIQAYVQPTPETNVALKQLQAKLQKQYQVAVTTGYGPRFLHSTGQLHKGDSGQGRFIQITADSARDADIPNEAGKPESGMSFQVLKMSQALGDKEALKQAGRKVIRFHVTGDIPKGITTLIGA